MSLHGGHHRDPRDVDHIDTPSQLLWRQIPNIHRIAREYCSFHHGKVLDTHGLRDEGEMATW